MPDQPDQPILPIEHVDAILDKLRERGFTYHAPDVGDVLLTAVELGWTVTPPQPKYRAIRRPTSTGVYFYEVLDRDGEIAATFMAGKSELNRTRAEAYARHLNSTDDDTDTATEDTP